MNKIDSFRGEYTFLSNFYPCQSQILYEGEWYRSVEHAFQAAKSIDPQERRNLRQFCRTAAEAKKFGRTVTLRKDWNNIRLDVMYQIVRDKFTRNSDLQEKLLATSNSHLVEGNWWHDTFWGVCDGKGENHLGKILMRVRKELT